MPDFNSIYNYPVVPEESEKHCDRDVVTRQDLETDFRNAMQFHNDWQTDPIFRQVFCEARLASVMWHYWYGAIEIREARKNPGLKGKTVPGWKKTAKYYSDNGIFICALNSSVNNEISKEQHDKLRGIFGRRWFGHNQGEWDGAYISQVANGLLELDPKRSRKAACRHYLDWMKNAFAKHHNHMVTVSSLGFGCHYDAELGSRMMGLELGEGLPSDTLLWSFCRGACRQYDLLCAVYPSVFSRKGGVYNFKCYPKAGQPQSVISSEGFPASPELGSSLGLMKRLWWVSYMNGASIIGLQFGYFPCDLHSPANTHGAIAMQDPVNDKVLKAHFTPLGWLLWEARETAKRHPFRGVPYTPVGVMLPFDHGWYPQPHCYAPRVPERIWGNIPYNSGDRMIDHFFQTVYPGYNKANIEPSLDERGKIVNTPYGDSFDMILDNAGAECLGKYRALIMLGSGKIDGDEHLKTKLTGYVENGGTLVVNPERWKNPPGTENKAGLSRIVKKNYGKGTILEVKLPENKENSFEIFREIYSEVINYLDGLQLVKIDGRPIYYLVNVTDDPGELMVTLCNNSRNLGWEGSIRIPGRNIVEAEEWLAYGEVVLEDGALRCGVPGNDVRIYRIKTDRPFLKLRYEKVPWRELGFGVPEWDKEPNFVS